MTDGLDTITRTIIGAALRVHRALGPGLLESAYEACLEFELLDQGILAERQKPLPLVYRGKSLDCAYRLDLNVKWLARDGIKRVVNGFSG